VLSEDLAKFDGQFEGAVNKIIEVLRSAFKGDESRVDFACHIADRKQYFEWVGGWPLELPESYVMSFQCILDSWTSLKIGNSMKYRIDKPVADLLDLFVKVWPHYPSKLTYRK
jgi:hypothetical protein